MANLDTQIKGSRPPYFGVDSGAANTYVVTTSAPLGPALRVGSRIAFLATNSNSGASTLNADSSGAKTIKKWAAGSLVDLASGDITAGQHVEVAWDGTYYQMAGSSGGGGGGGTPGGLNHEVQINSSGSFAGLATGSAGEYLRSGGASADPAFAAIAESEVTNLTSDLGTLAAGISSEASTRAAADALLTPTSRLIDTTAPLTGGGDLSADRTLAINSFTGDSGSGGAKGAVPAPGSGDAAANKFLKADGTWSPLASSGGLAGAVVKTANYTAVGGDNGLLIVFNSSSALTLTLPASPPSATWWIFVQNIGSATLTINRNGLNIDAAAANLSLLQTQGVLITTDNSNYFTERGLPAAGSGGGGGGGVPFASLDLTAQNAAYSGSLYTIPSGKAGLYRVSYYTKITRKAAGGGGTFVQGNQNTSNSISFSSNVTAGNFIAVVIRASGFSGVVVSDTKGNVYRAAGSVYTDASSNSCQLFYAYNVIGGSITITVTFGTGGSFPYLNIAEYSGITNTVDPLDQAAGTFGSSTTPTSPSVTTTQNSELIIGFGNSGPGTTWSAGTGYTLRESNAGGALEDKTLATAGSVSASLGSTTNGAWSCGIATFLTSSVSVQVTVTWTDNDDGTSMSQSVAALTKNLLTGVDDEMFVLNCQAGSAISVSVAYSSSSSGSGLAQYSFHALVTLV